MPSSLLAVALQLGPFCAQDGDSFAVRPFYAREAETTDVVWPLFTAHRDWWRLAFLVYSQRGGDGVGDQFAVLPFWFDGHDRDGEAFAGLFPLWGRHPHLLGLYDLRYALWPLWHSYRMPRTRADGEREWLTTHAAVFPFFSWRSDGAWGFWPLYGVDFARESTRRYALWPVAVWADYRADRDTAGEGYSWMCWPLCGRVRRERESRDLLLPPFFDFARAWSPASARRGNSGPDLRIRCPWPFFEYESTAARTRLSLWPVYERTVERRYGDGGESSAVTRWGWKLVELYDDETRVFPFWVSSRDYRRLWPFYEAERDGDVWRSRLLALLPIRHAPAVERNWAPFWTFYRRFTAPIYSDHELFWGLIRWRTWR